MPDSPDSAALDTDARALQRALTDLVRAYQFRDRDAICCYDVSPGQGHALERLAIAGPLTMNEFAAALFLEKSSASRLADGLERKGYLLRHPHPDDGRFVQLSLSKRGRALFEKIETDLIEERKEVLSGLGAVERRAVVRAVEKLAELAACGIGADACGPDANACAPDAEGCAPDADEREPVPEPAGR